MPLLQPQLCTDSMGLQCSPYSAACAWYKVVTNHTHWKNSPWSVISAPKPRFFFSFPFSLRDVLNSAGEGGCGWLRAFMIRPLSSFLEEGLLSHLVEPAWGTFCGLRHLSRDFCWTVLALHMHHPVLSSFTSPVLIVHILFVYLEI